MRKFFWNRQCFKHLFLLTATVFLSSCDWIKYFQETPPNTPTTTAYYIISVNLESPNLQVADLSVIKAPEGSKFQGGAIIAKIPGQIVLDKAGTWQFQARSDNLESEIVTLRVPEEHSVTITMP